MHDGDGSDGGDGDGLADQMNTEDTALNLNQPVPTTKSFLLSYN